MANRSHDVIWDRWEEVDHLFDQALGLAVEDRDTYLADACAGDEALLDTVSRLLDSADRGAAHFAGPGTELLRAALGSEPSDSRPDSLPAGTAVGRYRLLGEVGRGGMARVYEAERADGAFERRVAIKVLRGVDSAELGRRFVAERQILSSLSHPHIARLLDGGTIDDERPFLVMELVEGEPITAYADRKRLGVPERLELFTQVIEAVQYAHTRLVVHRDIKPSNVLVDGAGEARLLDFGIAKLLGEPTEAGPATRPATRWMTPQYASPEQILAQPVTTATDVHALGALLYELLTGHRPFGGDVRAGFELERAVCEEAPKTASTVVGTKVKPRDGRSALEPESVAMARDTTPSKLKRALSGDLDAVLSKCMRKDPEERYRSAQELGDDLRRHLSGFPVLAREGLTAYRARKFVGRHRLGVSAAALAATTLLTFTALLVEQRNQANESAALAATEAENAQLVVDFLADVFRGRDPNQAPSDTFTARELLDWGIDRVDAEFAQRPAVQANLLLVLGNARHNLGDLEEGIALVAQAIDLRRATFGSRSPEVAEALVRLGAAYRAERDFSPAEEAYREAAGILEDSEGHEPQLASALTGLGATLLDLRQPDSAEVLLRRALDLRPESGSPDRVASLLQLAVLLRNQGKLSEAEALYEEGIPSYRALPDREDGQLAAHLNNLGYLRRVGGAWTEAEASYSEALELSVRSYGRGHPNSLLVAANLASSLTAGGQPERALGVLRESAEAANAQWPGGHWRAAGATGSVGDALLRLGRTEEALPHLTQAAEYFERELGQLHDWTSFAYARIAVIRLLEGTEAARGKAFLDRLHSYLASRPPNVEQINQLEGFLFVLRDAGPSQEYVRFRAIHPDSVAVDAANGGS